jgi:hypothetical protein
MVQKKPAAALRLYRTSTTRIEDLIRKAHAILGAGLWRELTIGEYESDAGLMLLSNQHIQMSLADDRTWRKVITDAGRSAYWSALWLQALPWEDRTTSGK